MVRESPTRGARALFLGCPGYGMVTTGWPGTETS